MFQPRRTILLVNELDDAIRSAPEDLHDAQAALRPVFEKSCVYLRDLLSDPEFGFSVELLLDPDRQSPPTHDLTEFLQLERKALTVCGLSSSAIDSCIEELKANEPGNNSIVIIPDNFMETLARATEVVCTLPRLRFEEPSRWRRAVGSVAGVVGGIAVVSANILIATHADGGLFSGMSIERGFRLSYESAREIPETVG